MTAEITPKIAFIKARWHADTVDQAYLGFTDEIAALCPHAQLESFDVPGAFEMPLLAKKLALTGQFDAIVVAALVVDGGIYRHDFVANAVVNGLMNVGLETMVPCLSVSLTPHNYHESGAIPAFFYAHFVEKGREAARAVHQIVQQDRRITDLTLAKAAQ